MNVLTVLTIIVLGLSLWRYINIFLAIDELIPSFSKKVQKEDSTVGFKREPVAKDGGAKKRKISIRLIILVLLGIGLLAPLVYLGMYLIELNSQ